MYCYGEKIEVIMEKRFKQIKSKKRLSKEDVFWLRTYLDIMNDS